ncbi:MAG: 2-isopropylmalate synthase [Acidipropionibacterium jensenii]|nr:2-isopropylmalate synthase [Acidipropionibacterium jensenii]MDN5976875.1 2-isopropylmalate synthase [Acidipropionibacterium jensenii]MDN5996003.1 2-isopropylmalate synthase [Acidipropionibacterium jensenii]MDN6426825.1 2-isopropylmalate synthase [Acidipropionibacterium jensenii]MDN6440859.1 2-isopropylmalate synthase [Acidipropionibacterium jensenii]MDN6480407.1 2-isopropylmalate synthase [Acidipropionibacterium jensenii]
MPVDRYKPFIPQSLPDRTWPDKTLDKAPRWLSTDLRDGNQALIDPMTVSRKMRMFNLLIEMGYKEIEIGFPSASQTEYDFVRKLIEEDVVPDDVTISVLTQAREDLIRRTAQSLVGAHRATIHMYNATAELFRRVVFHVNEQQCIDLAHQGTEWVVKYAEEYLDDVEFGYEYSPEIFTQTPTDFALEVCESVMDVWQPAEGREIILNLPATVEMSTPNTFGDQIEYFCRNIRDRQHVCVSVHPHNDRGTGVAAAEFAQMAGADRVEGCLFGHGERTGNVDLVTLGMNLFSQGVDPKIDFSDMPQIRRTVEYCTGLPVPARQPYSGDLVFTAFSGSHQDAIKKGLEDLQRVADERKVTWQAPYLAVDPHDIGRTYEAVIRVNSQSGKGGMAYLMKTEHQVDLPRRLQIEFSKSVQFLTDQEAREISHDEIWDLFSREYLHTDGIQLVSRESATRGGSHEITATIGVDGAQRTISGEGNGAVSAFVDALDSLGVVVHVLDYSEHAMTAGGTAKAAAYVECEVGDGESSQILWGVGIDSDITEASLKAVIGAVNRSGARVQVGERVGSRQA